MLAPLIYYVTQRTVLLVSCVGNVRSWRATSLNVKLNNHQYLLPALGVQCEIQIFQTVSIVVNDIEINARKRRDCLRNTSDVSTPTQTFDLVSRVWGTPCGGSVTRGNHRKEIDLSKHHFEARASVRAYVVRSRDEGDAIDIVACIFFLCLAHVYAWKDLDSTHSYVNSSFMNSCKWKSEL